MSNSRTLAVMAVLLAPALAGADALDPKAVEKQLATCVQPSDDAFDPRPLVGAIQRADAIGKRPTTEAIQVTGKKARAYIFFSRDGCVVIPVVGKPAAYAKGDFGGGAKLAYVLRTANCGSMGCPTALTVKGAATTDDKALDALLLPHHCLNSAELERVALFTGHDSFKLACWSSSGADPDRTDMLIELVDGKLTVIADIAAGVGWVQAPDETHPKPCQARPPGGIAIVSRGDKPTIDASTPATEDEAKDAKVERISGGCDATIATRRHQYDPAARGFAAIGKPKLSTVHKLCKCPK